MWNILSPCNVAFSIMKLTVVCFFVLFCLVFLFFVLLFFPKYLQPCNSSWYTCVLHKVAPISEKKMDLPWLILTQYVLEMIVTLDGDLDLGDDRVGYPLWRFVILTITCYFTPKKKKKKKKKNPPPPKNGKYMQALNGVANYDEAGTNTVSHFT